LIDLWSPRYEFVVIFAAMVHRVSNITWWIDGRRQWPGKKFSRPSGRFHNRAYYFHCAVLGKTLAIPTR